MITGTCAYSTFGLSTFLLFDTKELSAQVSANITFSSLDNCLTTVALMAQNSLNLAVSNSSTLDTTDTQRTYCTALFPGEGINGGTRVQSLSSSQYQGGSTSSISTNANTGDPTFSIDVTKSPFIKSNTTAPTQNGISSESNGNRSPNIGQSQSDSVGMGRPGNQNNATSIAKGSSEAGPSSNGLGSKYDNSMVAEKTVSPQPNAITFENGGTLAMSSLGASLLNKKTTDAENSGQKRRIAQQEGQIRQGRIPGKGGPGYRLNIMDMGSLPNHQESMNPSSEATDRSLFTRIKDALKTKKIYFHQTDPLF